MTTAQEMSAIACLPQTFICTPMASQSCVRTSVGDTGVINGVNYTKDRPALDALMIHMIL